MICTSTHTCTHITQTYTHMHTHTDTHLAQIHGDYTTLPMHPVITFTFTFVRLRLHNQIKVVLWLMHLHNDYCLLTWMPSEFPTEVEYLYFRWFHLTWTSHEAISPNRIHDPLWCLHDSWQFGCPNALAGIVYVQVDVLRGSARRGQFLSIAWELDTHHGPIIVWRAKNKYRFFSFWAVMKRTMTTEREVGMELG